VTGKIAPGPGPLASLQKSRQYRPGSPNLQAEEWTVLSYRGDNVRSVNVIRYRFSELLEVRVLAEPGIPAV
jgi:hypothetical protein